MPIEPLHAQAESNLRFIRERMDHASRFTGVPGWGGILMGAVAIVAAAVASARSDPREWMVVWLVAAVIALLIGGWSMDHKARTAGSTMLAGKGQRFLLGLLPPLFAGAVLTGALFAGGFYDPIPGVWSLLGGCFMLLGVVALFVPFAWGNWLLAIGFGGLQVGFGWVIGRWHGG